MTANYPVCQRRGACAGCLTQEAGTRITYTRTIQRSLSLVTVQMLSKEYARCAGQRAAAEKPSRAAGRSTCQLVQFLCSSAALDDEQELVGSLNIYSYTASAFDPFDEALMRLFSVTAGQAITNARRWQ